MKKWTVKISKDSESALKAMMLKNEITREDFGVISVWVKEIETKGPDYIAASRYWGDHPLYGNWRGCRASCFSFSGRIIYKVIEQEIVIEVCRVTPFHDYKKKD